MPDELDGELLERFVQGDQTAFETLFRKFEADVYRWIMRIVRDRSASDDVLVEAFWRAYRGRARFDASRSFGAWLRRIATNAALDHGLVEPGDADRLTRRVFQCEGRACAPSWSKTYSAMTPVFGDPDAARSVNRIGPFGALRTK